MERIAVLEMTANGFAHIICGFEQLGIELHDVELDGDELQRVLFGNDDPDRLATIFYDLFLHDMNPLATRPKNLGGRYRWRTAVGLKPVK